MNDQQYEAVRAFALREGLTFDAAADHYMLYGSGVTQTNGVQRMWFDEEAHRKDAADAERARWNAEVDARKQRKRARVQ